MNNSEKFEFICGLAVILLVAVIGLKIYSVRTYIGNFESAQKITAKFSSVEGIDIGSKVKISGIKVGSVSNVSIDKESFRAIVEIKIDKSLKLPRDTSIKVSSDGILGGKFLNIIPGDEEIFIEDGGSIQITNCSVNLEELLSKFIAK